MTGTTLLLQARIYCAGGGKKTEGQINLELYLLPDRAERESYSFQEIKLCWGEKKSEKKNGEIFREKRKKRIKLCYDVCLIG